MMRPDKEQKVRIERPDGDVDVEPCSVDLHLGDELALPSETTGTVDVTDGSTYPEYNWRSVNETTLAPGSFALATTEERVHFAQTAYGQIHGRSSVGRLGLFIHNAGLLDAGFSGQVTLELYNASPHSIELESGMRICQLTVHDNKIETTQHYGNQGKYQNQRGVTPSKLYEDFQNE